MLKDRIDRILWVLLLLTSAALLLILVTAAPGGGKARGSMANKPFEREMELQARAAFLQKLYGPVEELRKAGQLEGALLKLDELNRRYPGEAHGFILQGEILLEMGAFDESVSSFVKGVQLDGDYIDANSPLTRRKEIKQLVDEGLKRYGQRSKADQGNSSAVLKKIYYLQSRLAGGCE